MKLIKYTGKGMRPLQAFMRLTDDAAIVCEAHMDDYGNGKLHALVFGEGDGKAQYDRVAIALNGLAGVQVNDRLVAGRPDDEGVVRLGVSRGWGLAHATPGDGAQVILMFKGIWLERTLLGLRDKICAALMAA